MKFTETTLPGVLRIDPKVYEDARGFFMETHSRRVFAGHGIDVEFVQTNHSRSIRNTLRGLHYQVGRPQGKLVRVIRGAVFDVVVDMRRASAAFGKTFTIELSESNRIMLYLPQGFAHGFCVLSDAADFLYACTDYYYPQGERGIIWNDPDLAVPWPVREPLLSEKDRRLPRFKDIPPDDLF
ncbi:MAG: dTDP-4-dehydrorhamnose 3,5-epimerase [Lentisphaerae bacterium]|nr:dTDP-4-dehydrorhamnose 3,5-epimerase [Lentisphaerota bacterium]